MYKKDKKILIILDCPFCGAPADIEMGSEWCQGNSYRVRCKGKESHCLDRWDGSREEAVASWNKRETNV